MTKILIIDDEQGIIDFMQMALESRDYTVISALDGEDGLIAAQQESPDIILLDVMMPGMDGFETCRRIKNNDLTKKIPVLFISAKAQAADVELGVSAGAEDYIIKPFEMNDLIGKIKKYVG